MLSPEEYNSLEKKAMSLLLDYGFIHFPIDIFLLGKIAFDVTFIKYSELEKEKREYILSQRELEDSFTIFEHWSDESITYKIYYNDSKNYYRQRYSIGHELKHIIYEEENPTEEDEEGADYFAKSLIAPKCLIIRKELESSEEIVSEFELGPEPSTYLFNTIQKRLKKYGRELFKFEAEFIEELEFLIKCSTD